MLEQVEIVCPRCGKATLISVSRSEGEERAFATTTCRECRARFIAMTQADGRVLLFDGTHPVEGAAPELLGVIQPPAGPSGYRVTPPEHLGLFDRGLPLQSDPPGVSDDELQSNVVALDRILHRPDGSRRDPADAARYVGWRTVWIAQLNEALTRRLGGPPPLSFPPGIFVSYRWGTDDQNDWVARLARGLKARGYPVTFDRDEPANPDSTVDVPELVSRVADARYFLAILDTGYAERIGTPGEDRIRDGWVFDEYNVAAHLSNARQLRIVGLLREDIPLPRGFRLPVPGTPGNTIDVRDGADLERVLADLFPAIGVAPDEATVREARALLARSYEALCAGDHDQAMAASADLTALLPGTVDGLAQTIRIALRASVPDVGLRAAEEALTLAPRSRELLRAAGTFAVTVGEPARAARHLGVFLETYGGDEPAETAQAHYALGSALDDLDQVHAGLAHLEIARQSSPESPALLNTLGHVYRRAGDVVRALECLSAGLVADPERPDLLLNAAAALIESGRYPEAEAMVDRLAAVAPEASQVEGLRDLTAQGAAGMWREPPSLVRVVRVDASRIVTCDACPARVPIGDHQTCCARCGSVVPIQPGGCASCGSEGRVVLVPGLAAQCPYCRRGRVSAA
ncbi:MAG: tetratricopeptide repeat protein [Vicinamibacterales bacterium]